MSDVCYTAHMSSTSIRDLDPKLWRELRSAAVAEGLPVGQLLNRIIAQWLAEQKVMDAEEAFA
jgi:predicted DNA-binding ribbon-helix-helix protein